MLCSSCSLPYLQQNISDDSWLPRVTCGGTATQMKIYPGLRYIMVRTCAAVHGASPAQSQLGLCWNPNLKSHASTQEQGVHTYLEVPTPSFSELLYGASHWMVALRDCMQPFWWTILQVADNSMKEKSLLHFQKAGEGRQ